MPEYLILNLCCRVKLYKFLSLQLCFPVAYAIPAIYSPIAIEWTIACTISYIVITIVGPITSCKCYRLVLYNQLLNDRSYNRNSWVNHRCDWTLTEIFSYSQTLRLLCNNMLIPSIMLLIKLDQRMCWMLTFIEARSFREGNVVSHSCLSVSQSACMSV